MTVAAVIHQPSKEAFEMFDDLLLLGAGGSVMYFGELKGSAGAVAYFQSVGFTMPLACNPAEYLLDVAQGEIEHDQLLSELDEAKAKKVYLLNQWHGKRNWSPEMRWSSGTKEGKSGDQNEDKNQDDKSPGEKAIEEEGVIAIDPQFEVIQSEVLGQDTMRDVVVNRYHDLKDHCLLIYGDFRSIFVDFRHWPLTIRTSAWQLWLCFKRSWRYYREERALSLYAEMALHCFAGLIVSSAGQKLRFIGPMPSPVCSVQALPLITSCHMPQDALYTQIGNFICFGVLFAAIASSSQVFSSEQPNYWRECSAGLLTVPYFVGHFLGNQPRMIASAILFFLSFSIMYRDTAGVGQPGLFGIILGLYWFGYSLGYLVSQIASPQNTSLMGVLFALVFAVLFSGVLPMLKDVEAFPQWEQFPWYLSGPRWAIEAFYVNSVMSFKTIPQSKYNDLYVGQPYVDVASVLQQVGYDINNYDKDVWGLTWNGGFWTCIALLLMYIMNRHKTR